MTKTLIKLEEPYASQWKRAYLNESEGRRVVVLYNSRLDRSSTSYARYLMAVKLGRILDKEEHVDHIDNNKKNDDIDNLQILSFKENHEKSNRKCPIMCCCPICQKIFPSDKHRIAKKTSTTKCCSRKCGYKQIQITNKKK